MNKSTKEKKMKPKAHWSFKVSPQEFDARRIMRDAEAAGLEAVVVRISGGRYMIATVRGTCARRAAEEVRVNTAGHYAPNYSLDAGDFVLAYGSGKWAWSCDVSEQRVQQFEEVLAELREKDQRPVRFAVRGY